MIGSLREKIFDLSVLEMEHIVLKNGYNHPRSHGGQHGLGCLEGM